MSRKQDKNLVVALDIGTSKIAVLVGEMHESKTIDTMDAIEIIGCGVHPSHGLRRGVVVDIEATVQSIQRAVEEAEQMAHCHVHSALTGIAGSHIHSFNSHGIVAIRDKEVTAQDVVRVLDAAKAVAISSDQQILHLLPQEFVIDRQRGVKEPIGMSGVRLEAKVHIVTGSVSAVQNISKCVRRCGIQISDIVLEQLASSYAILTEDEKELGVCMIDMGGGTTDIAVFTEGAISHTATIPIAGDHVTHDLAVALRTPTQFAETIKIEEGSVWADERALSEILEVPGITPQPRRVPRKTLVDVINARYDELFRLVRAELYHSGFADSIPAGMVLTGGASKMPHLAALAEKVFQMPIRLGAPSGIQPFPSISDNPSYATAVGLLLYGHQRQMSGKSAPGLVDMTANGLWSRMRTWFHSNF